MDSFEELGVASELVEALAAEGIEAPTPLQEAAIPVLRRGNNLLLAAGPGSGVTATWAVALLDRLESGTGKARMLVLAPTADRADHLGETIGRLATTTGHSVAALESHWVFPERADVLLGTPRAVLAAVKDGGVKLDEVEAIVVEQMSRTEEFDGLADIERVIEYLSAEAQRVVTALPLTEGVSSFAERHMKRAMTLPAVDASAEGGPKRGSIRFRIAPEPREAAALELVADLLAGDVRHVLVFCRSEDRAADVGDYLTLHGYMAGAPGDGAVPVWLGVDALEARAALDGHEGVAVLSCDVPADADTLDRRHALSEDGLVVVLPREVPHLRATARAAGYQVVPFPPTRRGAGDAITRMHDALRKAIEEEDTAPYLLALAPLFEEFDPAEVAAAAVALLRKRTPQPDARPKVEDRTANPAWAKLFLGVGERDGIGTGDLLGAITGEAGVPGEAVGRIEIKQSHTLVEVHDDVARKVIKALNGTTIGGRAVRADFDRPRKPAGPPRGGGGGRRGPGRG